MLAKLTLQICFVPRRATLHIWFVETLFSFQRSTVLKQLFKYIIQLIVCQQLFLINYYLEVIAP
ncbi:hypothetical protein EFR51_00005 [Latilactobacillus curvatus]|nr:hypothetical protein [Latilactobacillus curvatus]